MRDLLLTGTFSVLLVFMLRETWVGALVWTWFSLMNPHRLTYGFAFELPFAQVTAIATFLSLLWSKGRVRLPSDPLVYILIAFVLWACITTVFAIFPDRSVDPLVRVLKIQVMTLVCIAAIRERKHIELFVWICVLSIGFYGFKGGLFALATGGSYRVWGPADSFIQDNNALGLAIVMIIPLGYYLAQVSTRKWVRQGLMVFLVICGVAVLSTQSRGAFLAISTMSLFLWMRMRKKLLPGILMFGALLTGVALMPSTWESRMKTIGTYQADSSAMQRINAWETAINVANDRITGAGFAVANTHVFQKYSPLPEWVYTAHSIYFQALGEQGWIGLLLFLSMGALTFINAARLRKQAAERPETIWVRDLAGFVQVSMVGYAVGGAFLSLTYWDMPYNLMVMVLALKYWLKEERWKQETTGPFGSTSSVAAAEKRKLDAVRTRA